MSWPAYVWPKAPPADQKKLGVLEPVPVADGEAANRAATQPATQPAATVPLTATQAAAAEWGAATQGVQIRLAYACRIWKEGETPSFSASVRNRNIGEKGWFIFRPQQTWTVELDGVRYRWSGNISGIGLPADREYDGIPITLNEPRGQTHYFYPELASGKHALRVICPVFPADIIKKHDLSPRFEAVSNLVEFEVAPAI